MVSRNSRKQSVRQNGTHQHDRGTRISTRGRIDRLIAARNAARASAGNGLGVRREYPLGTLEPLVGLGSATLEGRSNSSSNSSPLGNRLTKNLFIAGTSGVGKTMLIRE